MKRWNTPEIDAIEINATESGYFDTECEFFCISNDSKKDKPPVTPVDPVDPVEEYS